MGKHKTLTEEICSSLEGLCLFQQEGLILDLTEEVCRVMENIGMTKQNLADSLSVSDKVIRNFLSGRTTPNLRFIADVFTALGVEGSFATKPIEIGKKK